MESGEALLYSRQTEMFQFVLPFSLSLSVSLCVSLCLCTCVFSLLQQYVKVIYKYFYVISLILSFFLQKYSCQVIALTGTKCFWCNLMSSGCGVMYSRGERWNGVRRFLQNSCSFLLGYTVSHARLHLHRHCREMLKSRSSSTEYFLLGFQFNFFCL